MPHKSNQKGFAAVEAILIAVVIALIGFVGWYVWHSNQQAKATLDAASKSAQSSAPKITKKKDTTTTITPPYMIIKAWGVRAPYNDKLSLEYELFSTSHIQYAVFSSKELDASDKNCALYKTGGTIERYSSGDVYTLPETNESTGKTAKEYATTLKPSDYGHVGDYYFFFHPAQGECGDSQSSMDLRQQTSSLVFSMVPKLEALPQ